MNSNITHKLLILIFIVGLFGCDQLGEDINQITDKNVEQDIEGKVWELDYISEKGNVLRDFPDEEDGYIKRVFKEYSNGEVKEYTLLVKGTFKKLTYQTVKYEIVEGGIKYASSETLDSINYKDNLLVLTRAYSDSTIDYNYFLSDEDLSSAVHFTEWDSDIPEFEGKVWELDYISEEGNVSRDFPAEEDGYTKRVFKEYSNGEVKEYTLLVKGTFKKLTYQTVKYEIVEGGIKYESSETLDSINYKDNLLVLTRAYSDSTIDYNYFISDEDLSSAVHFTEWDSDISEFEDKTWELDSITQNGQLFREYPVSENGYLKNIYIEYSDGVYTKYTELDKDGVKTISFQNKNYEVLGNSVKYDNIDTLDNISQDGENLTIIRKVTLNGLEYNYKLKEIDLSEAVLSPENPNKTSLENRVWKVQKLLDRDTPEEIMPKWAKVDVDGDNIQDYYTNFDMYYTFNDGLITMMGVYYLNQKIVKLEEHYNSYTVSGDILTQPGFFGGYFDNHFEVIENRMNLYLYLKDSEGNYDEFPKHTKFFEESNIDIFSLSEGDTYGQVTDNESAKSVTLEGNIWVLESLSTAGDIANFPTIIPFATGSNGEYDTSLVLNLYFEFNNGILRIHTHTVIGIESKLEYSDNWYTISENKLTWEGTSEPYSIDIVGDKLSLTRSFIDAEDLDYDDDTTEYVNEIYTFRLDNSIDVRNSVEEQTEETSVIEDSYPGRGPFKLPAMGEWIELQIDYKANKYFLVDVTPNTTYRVTWDDEDEGSGKYSADVTMSAYTTDNITDYFIPEDSGYNDPQTFTVGSEVKQIMVQVCGEHSAGSVAFMVEELEEN